MLSEKEIVKILKCIIDTMELRININNFEDMSKITKENYVYITPLKEKINRHGAFKILKFNPNKVDGFEMVSSLKELKIILNKALDEMGVIDKTKVIINRVDIAIDCDLDFKANNDFKFLRLIFELVSYEKIYISRWCSTNMDSHKRSNLFFKSRDIDIDFYDKKEQSKGKHLYKSRMEWRFKRVSTLNYEKHLDKLMVELKLLETKIEDVEKKIAKEILEIWEEEKEEDHKLNFSVFVKRHKELFYTVNVLKMVYAKSGLKGNWKGWLNGFRNTNDFVKFNSKSDVIKFKKEMIKAIKTYKKS